jgi:hypothetical protein
LNKIFILRICYMKRRVMHKNILIVVFSYITYCDKSI